MLPCLLTRPIKHSLRVKKKQDKLVSLSYDWSNKKILIVEDDRQSIIFYQSALRKTGAEIHQVLNGKEAVKKCKETKYDLVLMDIQLPDMDGYEATRRIKKIDADILIIAQTAFALSGEKQKCLEVGCDDYISKPIKITALLKLIDGHINNRFRTTL
ncbi:MAG: response regulator [Bacteroidales bacterium]